MARALERGSSACALSQNLAEKTRKLAIVITEHIYSVFSVALFRGRLAWTFVHGSAARQIQAILFSSVPLYDHACADSGGLQILRIQLHLQHQNACILMQFNRHSVSCARRHQDAVVSGIVQQLIEIRRLFDAHPGNFPAFYQLV